MKKQIDAETKTQIVNDYIHGNRILFLINKYHVSQDIVYEILNEAKIPIRTNKEVNLIRYNAKLKIFSQKIISLYESGYSINYIKKGFDTSKELIASREMIKRILKDNNIKLRGYGLPGNKNPHWKGGRMIMKNGYILVYSPNHPYAMTNNGKNKGYILEHRLVMEKKLGRYLKSKEIIHHIDGNRSNNDIDNLVLTNVHKHIGEHNSKRIWKEESKIKSKTNASKRIRDKSGRFLP